MSDNMVEYRYKLIPTGGDSKKYGVCEVCKQPSSDVYHQVEELKYEQGWTHAGCHDLFGHKECLVSKRRGTGKGWHGDSIGHSLASLKAQTTKANNTPMRTTKEQQPKDIWLSIRSNEMMRDTMKALIDEIKSHNIEYTSHASGNGNRLYLHLKNCPESFQKELGNWIYYQPITQMKKPPNISDYDVTDW